MGVVLHSQKEERKGWVRGGHSIRYGQSHISREDDKSAFYYRLHFEYESIYARDVVTFAYCYPYSFVDMEMYFHRLMFKRLAHALRIEKVKIGETLSGNPLYAFSIKCKKTAKRPSLSPDYKCDRPSALLPVSSLHSVVFLARQHPGESQSSYVL